jgi:hypothetical protein
MENGHFSISLEARSCTKVEGEKYFMMKVMAELERQ